MGFPSGSDGKDSAYDAGDSGFDPWLGKMPSKKEWLPTLVFLPGEFGTEELGELHSVGLQRVGHNWVTNT